MGRKQSFHGPTILGAEPFLQLFRFRVDVDRGQGDTARGLDGTETAQSSVGGVLQELAGRELMTLYRGGEIGRAHV